MMTKPGKTYKTIQEYLDSVEEPRRADIKAIHEMIVKTVPKLTAYVEGAGIGYGKFHYKYASGREGDCPKIGLVNNKQYISIYICAANEKGYISEQHKGELPKANVGKGCIRFKRWSDLDPKVMKKIFKLAEVTGFGV
ncbi:MAG TPA: DUF1801 domain-containing protein [Tepidisphaeraceae bacterium]|nr:DUF1801 domain-containing protein [Tepidisphaeraceae bacterium]